MADVPPFRIGKSPPLSEEEERQKQEFIERRGVTKLNYMVANPVPEVALRGKVNRHYKIAKHHKTRSTNSES